MQNHSVRARGRRALERAGDHGVLNNVHVDGRWNLAGLEGDLEATLLVDERGEVLPAPSHIRLHEAAGSADCGIRKLVPVTL